MTRTNIINAIAKKIDAKSYLEIGTREGSNFDAIDVLMKVGVDPDPKAKAHFHCTSDEFFVYNRDKFDLIFVDGLHHFNQVYRDINNALKVLNEGGYIVCHDMNPTSELMQRVPREVKQWTGDCWKAWAKLRTGRSDLAMFVVDCDFGVGVITRGSQKVINYPASKKWQYSDLEKDRNNILNLITVKQFEQWVQQ